MGNKPLSGSEMADDCVSLPGSFFTSIVPGIRDLAELKTVLYTAYLVLLKQGEVESGASGVAYKDLKAEISRMSSELDEEALRRALKAAVEHGALLHSTLDIDGALEEVYSLAPSMCGRHQVGSANVFALYEQNIGMITPMIAEELKEAEKLYPPLWIEDAFREAVTLNKRSWKYVARILERWASEGKDSGEHKGNAKEGGPDKYIKGKYGHLVKR